MLAFENMSGDPEQEYFSDGISDDIITALSRSPWLFIIARNTTFTYKGTSVDVRRVAEDLGVRFVLEGSVRRSGDRVRVAAQLIDGTTGGHLWSERYDGQLEDVLICKMRSPATWWPRSRQPFTSAQSLIRSRVPRAPI